MDNFGKIRTPLLQLERFIWGLATVWTIIVATSLLWHMVQTKQESLEEAQIQARVAYEKDIVYRRWNTGHGGVYVPVTKETQPNPHLSDISERDITTSSGKTLTLMNPAYMTRQAHELEKQKLGVRGHITSLNPIRPENAPDSWETEALRAFERGEAEISSVEDIEGKKYMRLMCPLITEKGCLKCHAKQGYHEGDIRGGISVSIPMEPFWAIERKHIITFALVYGLLWMVGLCGLGLGNQRLMRTERERRQAEEALQKAHDELERKVEERTADLSKANIFLKREISERKRAEEQTKQLQEYLQLQINRMPIGLIVWDTEFRVQSWNPAAERIFRFTEEEALGKHPYDLIVPKELQRHVDVVWHRLLESDATAHSVNENITKDGRIIICEWTNTPLREADGTATGVLSMVQDITERKRAEEELKLSEHRYRNLIDTARDVIFTLSIDGTISSLNPAFEALIGWARSEWVGKSFVPLVHPSDKPLALEMFRVALQGETTPLFELHMLTKQSEYIVGEFIAVPQFEDGQVVGILGIARDITERKRAEEALKESEEYLKNLFDSIRAGIIIIDTETHNIIDVNSFALEIIGVSKEQILNRVCHKYICPAELGKCPITDLKQNVDSSERVLIKGNSERIPILKSVVPVIREGRRYLIESFINITEHKRAEEEKAVLQDQFRQSQKMEAIGSLAGGIAHDFNNLLTVIKGYSQLSLMELKEGDPLKPNIEEVQKAAERAAGLTRQLLAFSRRQILDMKVLDLNTILRDLDKMLRRVIGEDIGLVTLLADDLGTVKADAGQIEQVVMNLAVNARDAMQKGGKLTIETANVELDENYARNHVAVKPGPYVMLSVSDTGVGMTPEVRDRVFEPFFTTKEKGKGTGLGLSTVYGIVKQSGGNIWVYSELGKGTAFKIYLARVDEPLEEAGEVVVQKELNGRGETILVVEDEEKVRQLTVQILTKNGYTVLEASHGDEASHICEQHKGPIHLMVMDVVMPGMNGRELAKSLEPHHPEMKVLYMSGYTDNAIVHHGILEKGLSFLQKPFTLEGLLRKVREVLDK